MGDAKSHRHSHQRQKVVAFCTVLIVVIIILLVVLYFVLFRPKDPRFNVQSVTLQSLDVGAFSDQGTNFANITLILWILVKNPNRATFYFTDSAAYMYFYGVEVGFSSIPRGRLESKSSRYLTVPLTVESLYALSGPYLKADISAGWIPVATATKLSGHVKVLNIFSHHGSATSLCYVYISLKTNNIMDYRCKYGVRV